MAPSSIYTAAAKRATSTIPIIFMSHADPLGTGHVASLARPGGNVTGLSLMMTETNVKGLELLKEAVPGLSRVAVIFDPATPVAWTGPEGRRSCGPSTGASDSTGAGAQRDGVRRAPFRPSSGNAPTGFWCFRPRCSSPGPSGSRNSRLAHKLPSLFGPRQHVEAGGLMSYSPDRADLWRRGAIYVDKILQRCQARGSAGAAADEVRARHQSQDRQGNRANYPAIVSPPRRRGDRIRRRYAEFGT